MHRSILSNTPAKNLTWMVGSLSRPKKMPGYAWSIPAELCKTGGKLRNCKDTICSNCYAMKGRYRFGNTIQAMENRFDKWQYRDQMRDLDKIATWSSVMAELIRRKPKKSGYFRWFDSGDLYNEWMFVDIIQVARYVPTVQFWLPTQERGIVKRVMTHINIPLNLNIRISDVKVGGNQNQLSTVLPWTSGVKRASIDEWKSLVDQTNQLDYYCPAPLQENNCGDCRACWDWQKTRIIYKEH